jgi:hypothetical protein
VARTCDRADAADRELRRARIIVAVGVLVWAVIAAVVMARHGAIASVVLVGWGGSIVVCVAGMFGPFALAELRPTPHHERDDDAADEAQEVDVIDLRDSVLEQHRTDEVPVPLG